MGMNLLLGDCLERLKELEDNSVDAVITDPPYQLSSITKRFGKDGSAAAQFGTDGAFQRASKGFMGKEWDVLPPVETWKEVLRVLKPGAWCLVMTTPRQDSLCQVLVDLSAAGFKMGFSSLYFCYASGFPKAHNISKVLDKRANGLNTQDYVVYSPEKPEVNRYDSSGRYVIDYTKGVGVEDNKGYGGIARGGVGIEQKGCWIPVYGREVVGKSNINIYKEGKNHKFYSEDEGNPEYERGDITIPSSPEAKQFEGAYGGFQPKPAVEVILVCQKPMTEKTFVGQVLDNGKGVTWLDDCRIPYETIPDSVGKNRGSLNTTSEQKYGYKKCVPIGSDKGRFPANLLISDDVLDDGRKRGQGHWSKSKTVGYGNFGGGKSDYFGVGAKNTPDCYSRFFSLDAWAEKNLPFLITPKGSKSEKNKGVENLMIIEVILCVENMEQETLLQKGMSESITKWSTGLFGKETMEKSQMDLKYITKTETNKITTLIILNSKMTLNIKDYIVDAIKTKREIGGNLVENAENTNEWNKIITKNLMEYILGANPAVLETQLKIKASVGNFHSTVKPIKLMSYLITMTTRPGDVVLDPFMGSGSTGCAAVLLRREFIGVEMDEGYMEISKKRIDYWNGKVDKKTDLFEE